MVPHAHGGPNHISNCFLAHSRCNTGGRIVSRSKD
ncbi:HNH endonuclease [Sinorhizobium medicae]